MSKSLVIIGGGLGGLSLALIASKKNWKVKIIEKNSSLGGKLNQKKINDLKWDSGPSLITYKNIFDQLLSFSEKNNNPPKFIRLDNLFRYKFSDGTNLDYVSNLNHLIANIQKITEDKKDVMGFLNFIGLGEQIFNLSEKTFFRNYLFNQTNLQGLKELLSVSPIKAFGNYSKNVSKNIKNPNIQQLLLRYPTYVGSSPYKAPSTLCMIPYLELAYGGWYIKNGLYELVNFIKKDLIDKGCEIIMEEEVNKIEISNNKINSISTKSGSKISGDEFAFNIDPDIVYKISDGKIGKNLKQKDASMSGVVILGTLPIKSTPKNHHTVIFSNNYKQEFDQIFDDYSFPDEPTIYINNPPKNDNNYNEKEIFIMANAPPNGNNWSDENTKSSLDKILNILDKKLSIANDLKILDIWDPNRFFKDYNCPFGSIYGRVSHGWLNTFHRNPLKKSKNTHFLGGGAHPGGGTPTVIISAFLCAKKLGIKI